MAGGPRPASGDGHGPAAPGKAGLPVMSYSCPPPPTDGSFQLVKSDHKSKIPF